MDAFDFGAYSVPAFEPVDTAPREPAPSRQPESPSQATMQTTGGSVKLLPPSSPARAPGGASVYQPPAPVAQHPHLPSSGPRPHGHRVGHYGHGRRHLHGMGEDTSEQTSNLLGLALITVPVAAVFGAKYAGLLGALGGALVGGAAVNVVRAFSNMTQATPGTDKEATVSGTFAALGALGGGYLLYKGHKDRGSFRPNEPEPDDDPGYDIGKFRI
jgi:hypothetical protein